MTSPYLKRPIRSLEQALRDRDRALVHAAVEAQMSLALAGGSLLPVPFMARPLPCVMSSQKLTTRPTRRTTPNREAA